MGRQHVNILIEVVILVLASMLVQPLSIVDSFTLCLLFVSVLVMARGFLYQSLMLIDLPYLVKSVELKALAELASSSSSFQHLKHYAVARGIKPGNYRMSEDCAPQVIGVKGAVYKSFMSRDKVEEFLDRFR